MAGRAPFDSGGEVHIPFRQSLAKLGLLVALAPLGYAIWATSAWVYGADDSHGETTVQGKVLERVTEILENQQGERDVEKALKEQRKRLMECIRRGGDPVGCLREEVGP